MALKKAALRKIPAGKAKPGNTVTAKPLAGRTQVSSSNHQSFPIVGPGASAGALGAFPSDSGLAFVLVSYLDPKHESRLTGLLSHATSLPIREARDAMRLAANQIPGAGRKKLVRNARRVAADGRKTQCILLAMEETKE